MPTAPPEEHMPLLSPSQSKTDLAFSVKKYTDSDDEGEDLACQDAINLERVAVKYSQKDPWYFPVTRRGDKGPDPPKYSAEVEKCIRPKPPPKHSVTPGPPPPRSEPASQFQRAIKEAESNGNFEFSFCCPVMYGRDSDGEEWPLWEVLPYKVLKELKLACAECGLTAPYTLTLVDALSGN